MMWNKKDSKNLESIAKSLERIADREQERSLIQNEESSSFTNSIRKAIKGKSENIRVTSGIPMEDQALEEELNIAKRINTKVIEAERVGNSPFFTEALLDEDELETL